MGLSGFQLFKHVFKKGCIMLAITCSWRSTPLEILRFGSHAMSHCSQLTGSLKCLDFLLTALRTENGALISLSVVPSLSSLVLKNHSPFTLIGPQTLWFPESRGFDSFGGACRADCASYLHTSRHLHPHVTSTVQLREL